MEQKSERGVDLFKIFPILKYLVKLRSFQFLVIYPGAVFFYIFLLAGIFGNPYGGANIIIIFIWILWWFLLITFMVPLASRIWCMVCPLPAPGEWLQRKSIVGYRTGSKPGGLNKAWPRRLRNIWIQNFGFLGLATFSLLLVTRPIISVLVVGGIGVIAFPLMLIYRKRAFCVYLCPVSGFQGLYAMTAKVGLRAREVELCNRIKPGEEFCFDDGIAPCRLACPAGVDASSYIALIGRGKDEEALEVIREAMPFVGVCGRVCTHPCEDKCARAEIDEAVSICRLKRFVADRGNGHQGKGFTRLHEEKIAVIGAGPAGLTCAYHLARKGYRTTVYESLPTIGGMLRVGIPDFHLPKEIVDKEIEFIKNSGVKIVTGTTVGKDIEFEDLQREYQVIFVAVGASEAKRLNIEGKDREGVYTAVDFLRKVNLEERVEMGKKVVVIGGGKTAEDTARTALRLGAEEAMCIEIRAEEDMLPLDGTTEAEGVKILYSTSPVKIMGDNGKATSLLCVKMRKGEIDENTGHPRLVPVRGSEHLIPADTIIMATGQYSDITFLPKEVNICGTRTTVNPQTMQTNLPGIFAGGDVVSGPDVLIYAIAAGRKAALSIERYLRGEELGPVSLHPIDKEVDDLPLATITRKERIHASVLPLEQRREGFREIELAFTEKMAREEAGRCLECGICGVCYRGSEDGWPCPWFQKMGSMDRNNYCGLCMECVKTCPKDNVGLYWRPFCGDKEIKGYDESWKSFIMLVLALVYSVTLLGPYGVVKDLLNFPTVGNVKGFILYAGGLWAGILLGFPLVYYLFIYLSRWASKAREVPLKDLFIKYSYVFVPLGLFAWIAFSVPLLQINGSYVISLISDPFGWGWNLFGTKHFPWTPFHPGTVPYIQAPLLMFGMVWSVRKGYDISRGIFADKRRAWRSLVPVAVLLLGITAGFLFLFTG